MDRPARARRGRSRAPTQAGPTDHVGTSHRHRSRPSGARIRSSSVRSRGTRSSSASRPRTAHGNRTTRRRGSSPSSCPSPSPSSSPIAGAWFRQAGVSSRARRTRADPPVPNRLDLGEEDERLNGLALAEVEPERLAVLGAVLVGEPEAEQPPRGRRGSGIVLRAPGIHARPHSVDGVRAFAGLAPLRDGVRIARRSRGSSGLI